MKAKKQPTKRVHRPPWEAPPTGSVIDIKNAFDVQRRNQIDAEAKEMAGGPPFEDPYANCNPRELRCKALKGDEEALFKLVALSFEFTSALNSIALEKPELLRPRARPSLTWPVLHSRAPLVAKQNKALFDTIELAGDWGVSWLEESAVLSNESSQKQWALRLLNFVHALRKGSEFTQATARVTAELLQRFHGSTGTLHDALVYNLNTFVAKHTLDWPLTCLKYTPNLLEQARKLPPLSPEKAVLDRWWAVASDLLMLNTDGAPQQIPELRAVGECVATHPWCLKPLDDETHGDEPYDAAKGEIMIRRKIVTDLREEFDWITRQLAKAGGAAGEAPSNSEAV